MGGDCGEGDDKGRETIRVGRPVQYILRYGNSGNINANDILLWIEMPSSWQVQTDLPSVSEFSEISHEDQLTFCVWINKIPAGTTSDFTFYVTTQEATDEEIKVGLISSQHFWGSQWYLPGEKPPRGSTAVRLSKDGGVGHIGVVVDDWEVVDLVRNPDGSYEVREQFDLRDTWHEGEYGEGLYLGAGTPDGWTPELGNQIAENALNRIKETGKYWVVPFPDDTKNCVEFVSENYESAGINLGWNAITSPASVYEGLSHKLWPEYRGVWRLLAPSYWIEGDIVLPFRWVEFKRIESVSSTTPEDKYGPVGFDHPDTPPEELKRFVPTTQNFYYKIDFWNAENATAPACDVYVNDQLDTNLNKSTVRFEEIGFLNWTVELEPCQYFNVYVDTRPEMELIVNAEGTFDPETGAINWTFRSLDPDTLEMPDDPMAGFLPPITESGYEIGWASFSVDPEHDLPTGTQIKN